MHTGSYSLPRPLRRIHGRYGGYMVLVAGKAAVHPDSLIRGGWIHGSAFCDVPVCVIEEAADDSHGGSPFRDIVLRVIFVFELAPFGVCDPRQVAVCVIFKSSSTRAGAS